MKTLLVLISIFILNKIIAQDQFSVLLYTRHDDYHSNIIPVAIKAFEDMAETHQFKFDWTQRPNELTEKLPEYDVLIFMNANADSLNTKHMDVLKTFMNQGGGFVGIHATSNGKKENPWFDGLVGAKFINHPKHQVAIIDVVDENFPATMHLPKRWLRSDEWYNLNILDLEQLNVILNLDETSYDYKAGYNDIPLKGMGEKHPIAWYQEYEGGRSFYTAIGHQPKSYENENFLNHIFGAIYWVKGN